MNHARPLVIKGGRIIDPAQGLDEISDLLIRNGEIQALGSMIKADDAHTIDAQGLVISPGFIDIHCHLREPGFEYKETIESGTAAAARGGFTTVCAMPNTNPVTDSRSSVEFVLQKARSEGAVNVLPIGAVTKGSRGEELAEMAELAEAGVIGFSDDGNPVEDANIMRQALSYASGLGLPIINHCEVPALSAGGVMSEGWISNRLGLKGIPRSAEEAMVARDISLVETTGGRLHIAHASTAGTIALVRGAKARGVRVTCEVTPHHLTLTDEAILGNSSDPFEPLSMSAYDTNAKVAPPLRSRVDVAAAIEGLRDGSVDFIATDHAPHGQTEKVCTFEEAANGISVLETALGSLMGIVHNDAISLPLLIEKLTKAPASFLGKEIGSLKPGCDADITIFDPNAEWTVLASSFASKGKNTPLDGERLKGKVIATIVGGQLVYGNENNLDE